MSLSTYDERKLRTDALRYRAFVRDVAVATTAGQAFILGSAWASMRLRRLVFMADAASALDASNYWSIFARIFDPDGNVYRKEVQWSRVTLEKTRTLAIGNRVVTGWLDEAVPKDHLVAVVFEETGTAATVTGRVQADLLVGGR